MGRKNDRLQLFYSLFTIKLFQAVKQTTKKRKEAQEFVPSHGEERGVLFNNLLLNEVKGEEITAGGQKKLLLLTQLSVQEFSTQFLLFLLFLIYFEENFDDLRLLQLRNFHK